VPAVLGTYRVHPDSKSAGAPLAKAKDYVRFADEVLRPDEREGRTSAYLAAGEYFYDALELGPARRYLLRSAPRRPSARSLSLLGKAFLPRPVVARLKERRAARR
jgi:hypothetical protein